MPDDHGQTQPLPRHPGGASVSRVRLPLSRAPGNIALPGRLRSQLGGALPLTGPVAEARQMCRWSWACLGLAVGLLVLAGLATGPFGKHSPLALVAQWCLGIAFTASGIGVGLAVLASARVLTRSGERILPSHPYGAGALGILLLSFTSMTACALMMRLLWGAH
jgi:hypothetical protein